MNLQYTLQRFALQLKNKPRTLKRVARVFEKIMKTLYDTYFRNAEARRPGLTPTPQRFPISSQSHGCLKTSVKTAKTKGIDASSWN